MKEKQHRVDCRFSIGYLCSLDLLTCVLAEDERDQCSFFMERKNKDKN